MSGIYDIEVEQGATYILPFVWHAKNPDGTPGAPRDLTGWTARMQIRKKQKTPTLVDATTANDKIVLGPPANDLSGTIDLTNGRVVVVLSDEDTDLITSVAALYDLELVRTSPPRVIRLLRGKVTVIPNITQIPEDPEVGA